MLGLWPLEVDRWVARYEDRPLTSLERRALATVWIWLGGQLGIGHGEFLSTKKGRGEDGDEVFEFDGGCEDALLWLKELEGWSRGYEEKYQARTDEGVVLGRRYLDNLIPGFVPGCLKPRARRWAAVFVEPGLRGFMGYV